MQTTSKNQTVVKGKKTAIISYLTFVGLAWALLLNKKQKNPFAKYHIRQSLGITTTAFVFLILISILHKIPNIILQTIGVLGCCILVSLCITGIQNVLNYKRKPIPFIGVTSNQLFKVI